MNVEISYFAVLHKRLLQHWTVSKLNFGEIEPLCKPLSEPGVEHSEAGVQLDPGLDLASSPA